MIEKTLAGIGLSEKEIVVYLCSVKMGTQPASTIARRTQLPRNTARFMLDRLVEKGFVRKATRANMQLYSPENPESLIESFKYQKAEINEGYGKKIEGIKKALEELQARYRPKSTKPKVSYYEGREGVISMYEETLRSSEPIRSFGCYDVIGGVFSDYFKTHHARRLKEGIRVRRIHPDTATGIAKAKEDGNELRESRLIPHGVYYFTPEILAYDAHFQMISWKEQLGINIESLEIAKAFKAIFELAWKEADRIDPRNQGKRGGSPNPIKKTK
jgi:sugar-specific transcriptional regulator TrmB